MVSRVRTTVKQISQGELFLDRLPGTTRRAFLYFIEHHLLPPSWYLAGGTALSLQIGHRQSQDLDFFTTQARFNEIALERRLFATGEWATTLKEEGTLYGTLMSAKVSFIAYPFFHPRASMLRLGHVQILNPQDIAVMKIVAISQRGRKRDFVDLYWYCQNRESLRSVLLRVTKQYPGQEQNMHHFLKSLIYFKDAESDPMPRLLFKTSWRMIKNYFEREVPRITRELLV